MERGARASTSLERGAFPLPEATLAHLAAADAETLGLWAERLLDARTLDEVFRDDP